MNEQHQQHYFDTEDTLHSLFEINHAVMLLVDPESAAIIDANPAACKFYGYSRHQFKNLKISDINTLNRDKVIHDIKLAESQKKEHFYFQHKLANGDLRDVEVYSGPINVNGRQVLYSIIHDISERTRIQYELIKSREQWEKTFNAISDVVTIHDKDNRIIKANKACGQVLGLPVEKIIGSTCYSVFHGSKTRCDNCPFAGIADKNESLTAEVEYKHLKKTFQVSTSPIFDKDGEFEGSIHISKDITSQIKFESHFRHSQKMEAIGTLAGGIAHDFNNILAAILGYTDIAINETDSESPVADYLGQVVNAAERAKEMIKQILAFSRRSEQEKRPIRPQQIIKESIKLIRASIPSNIHIIQNIDEDSDAVHAEPSQIQQLIMNLCTNAYHAMRKSGGVMGITLSKADIKKKTATEGIKPGKYLLLEISDTGHGIDPQIQERIFEPYFTTKDMGEGTGMGLSVVHGIVKQHNGYIKVFSEPGVGSTFSIYLPRIQYQERETAESPNEIPKGNEHLLVVDDDEAITQILQIILNDLGYETTTANSSREALNYFRDSPGRFDAVLTDMSMPNLTGDQLAEKMLSIRPDTPIILITGFSEIIDEEQAERIGIKRFLMKPVGKIDLAVAIRNVLDAK